MIDTFKPLLMTEYAVDIEDPNYYLSWLSHEIREGGIQMNTITS